MYAMHFCHIVLSPDIHAVEFINCIHMVISNTEFIQCIGAEACDGVCSHIRAEMDSSIILV